MNIAAGGRLALCEDQADRRRADRGFSRRRATSRNRTPDKLPPTERDALFAVCDEALRRVVDCLQPSRVVGVGRFAEARARLALGDRGIPIGHVLHPSPASPAANRSWDAEMTAQLAAQGVVVGLG